MSAIERLKNLTSKSNDLEEVRRNYVIFLRKMADDGWSDDDVQEYKSSVTVLMKGGEGAMNLFPEGVYDTPDQAIEGAKSYWKEIANRGY